MSIKYYFRWLHPFYNTTVNWQCKNNILLMWQLYSAFRWCFSFGNNCVVSDKSYLLYIHSLANPQTHIKPGIIYFIVHVPFSKDQVSMKGCSQPDAVMPLCHQGRFSKRPFRFVVINPFLWGLTASGRFWCLCSRVVVSCVLQNILRSNLSSPDCHSHVTPRLSVSN